MIIVSSTPSIPFYTRLIMIPTFHDLLLDIFIPNLGLSAGGLTAWQAWQEAGRKAGRHACRQCGVLITLTRSFLPE